jgi:Tripartite tricarboxylate transporter TctB family
MSDHASVARPVVTRFVMEIATACLLLAAGVAVVFGALEYQIGWDDAGPQPGYFPFFIGLIIVVSSLGVLGQTIARRRPDEVFWNASQARRVAAFFLPIVAFVVLSLALGLYVATALYLIGAMVLQGGYRLPFATLIGAGTAVSFFVLFEILFKQPLLKGPVEAFFGFY